MNKGRTISLNGYHGKVVFPLGWLQTNVGSDYMDFLSKYTYDDTEYLNDQFRREVREHYEPLIEDALSNYDEDDEENNHLQCTWLEESGDRKEEWVLNVGTIIIEDGMTQELAERLYYILT